LEKIIKTRRAGAILDRLLQSAEIIPFKGKSYRLRNGTGKPEKEAGNEIQC
jgi:DNA replication protein DnaC